MITYHSDGAPIPPLPRRPLNAWIKQVATLHGRRIGDIAYIFCDDERILEVNRSYLHHDYYTDVITFDYSEPPRINGDIFISLDTVHSNAALFHTPYEQELHRVIIHGVLHLCGINDKAPGEREAMERAEDEALALLPQA